MTRHVNIPIFIPHLGCPNQCVFCNQRTISGVVEFDIESVRQTIEDALSTTGAADEVEIAFFGGSFTGIDRDLMQELLEIAYDYVKDGRVTGIRCSTRPDYINEEILAVLKRYGVRVIELGLQSSDDRVLLATKRGHDFSSEEKACRMITENGFSLVGQMMIGLPYSDEESELQTAKFIISQGAKGARIYPTVVFRDTELCQMAMCGEYTPLTDAEAVRRTALVMREFIDCGIDVIRVGLCASENLTGDETYYAGPNHPAIGELVENELYYSVIYDALKEVSPDENSNVTVFVPKGALSKAIGQKKINKIRIQNDFSHIKVRFSEREELAEYCVSIERQKECT